MPGHLKVIHVDEFFTLTGTPLQVLQPSRFLKELPRHLLHFQVGETCIPSLEARILLSELQLK